MKCWLLLRLDIGHCCAVARKGVDGMGLRWGYLRDSLLGEVVAHLSHAFVNLGPVVADAFVFLVAQDDGDAEVKVRSVIPLLLRARHLDDSDLRKSSDDQYV